MGGYVIIGIVLAGVLVMLYFASKAGPSGTSDLSSHADSASWSSASISSSTLSDAQDSPCDSGSDSSSDGGGSCDSGGSSSD
jgi:hypothetical protein